MSGEFLSIETTEGASDEAPTVGLVSNAEIAKDLVAVATEILTEKPPQQSFLITRAQVDALIIIIENQVKFIYAKQAIYELSSLPEIEDVLIKDKPKT